MTSEAKAAASPVVMKGSGRWRWVLLGCMITAIAGGASWWVLRPRPIDLPVIPVSELLEVPAGPDWFRDVTAESGIDFTYRNGEEADRFTILETLGGGVAMIDYDGDGLLDLFFTGGGVFEGDSLKGRPCKLYKNLGNFKFRDVTAEVGLDKIDYYSHGAAVADFNRDGWPDLLVTGYGRLTLFRNDKGKRFIDVTADANLRDPIWATSAGWADLTGSGFPDLYICQYVDWSFANNPRCKGRDPKVERDVCTPGKFKALRHMLYRNLKDGTFQDVSGEQGLRTDGRGLGVMLVDFNGDGRPDIFVANDESQNHLYFNRGGKLEEKALLAGVAVDEGGMPNGSMGVDVSDFDGSGRPSLFITNFQGEIHSLFQNNGKESFSYRSRAVGIASLSRHFVAFGTAFLDVDNDGWDDLFFVNGHVDRFPVSGSPKQVPVLLRNIDVKGRRHFQDWSKRGGKFFTTPAMGRGIAVGDLDNDGWPDAVISNTNSSAVVLRNTAATENPARWLGIKLIGKDSRDVAGSTVVLKGTTRSLTRFARGGGSYLSASDRRLLFGLGTNEQVKSVTVRWSWGAEQTWDNLEPGSYWELREGEPAAKRMQ
ncbi:MAG TPA: CRTAC1 family protein [Gemmataceae bacterium]|nr:CRTAC1 family protein [Gemmataceae bacterium]